ncbi:MAG: hypothetical protein K2X87_23875 [Gemmataceae bacterium]|nr:hypothetical protein [Gemmataceae bacterium]
MRVAVRVLSLVFGGTGLPAGAAPASRPVPPRRKARVAVLSGAGFALLAHLGLAVAVETSKPHWRDPEFYHRQRRLAKVAAWEREQGHARPVVAVLGGSRPQMGLSPEHLGLGTGPADPLVFNLCQSGCLPPGLRLNLARLFDAGPVPDFVLIEVLPPALADPGPPEARLPAARLGHADLVRLDPYLGDPAKARRGWLAARAGSWHTLRLPVLANWGLADRFPPGTNRPDLLWAGMRFHGWGPFYPGEWTHDQRAAGLGLAARQYRFLLDGFQVQPINDRLYRDMLAACRDRGVKAALYTMPESPAFRAWYPPGVRERIAAYLAGLSREFGVPVFDTSAWVDDEAAFLDGHHLLGPAAEAFSRRLGAECVGHWVRGTGGSP